MKSLNKCCKLQGNPEEKPDRDCKTPATWDRIWSSCQPKYKSQSYLKTTNVNVLEWPSHNPGLNPVENL